MMTDPTPTTDRPPLDLDAIRDRLTAAFNTGNEGRIYDSLNDVPWLLAEVTALRAELDAARAEADAFDELVDRTIADANKALTQRDDARAYVALHVSPECQHNVHSGCDEGVPCTSNCWCTCHGEQDAELDAARAERTEPATGEDVDFPPSPKDDNDYSWGWNDAWHLAHDELLAARATVLGQVDAALRDTDAILRWRDLHKIEASIDPRSIGIAADYLRGKFIAGSTS